MQALTLDDDTLARVKALLEYGEANPISMEDLQTFLVAHEGRAAIGDLPGRSTQVPLGFRISFSVEQQPAGWCKHLSISCQGKLPHPVAAVQIMQLFKMRPFSLNLLDPGRKDTCVYQEQNEANHSINILQLLDENGSITDLKNLPSDPRCKIAVKGFDDASATNN